MKTKQTQFPLNGEQTAVIGEYLTAVNKAGKFELVDESNAIVRWASLAHVAWSLEMPIDPQQIVLLLKGTRDEVTRWQDRRKLRHLSVQASAYLNNLLPSGYYVIPHGNAYLITQTVCLPFPQ